MRANLYLQKVSIDNFDIDALKEAARQGRLYLAPAEVSEEQRQADILHYVSRIAPCATESYKNSINQLWQAIATHPAFADCWHIRRGQRKGQVNRSFVTSIVDFLRDRGVYRADSTTHLHCKLEDVSRRNTVYNNMAQYPTTRAQRKAIEGLMHEFRIFPNH